MPGDEPRPRELERRIEDLSQLVRAFGPVSTQVAGHEARLSAAVEDVHDLKVELAAMEKRLNNKIEDVGKKCDRFHDEYRTLLGDRARGRTLVAVAVIGGSFTVLASIVGAVAVILSGGG